MTESEARLKRCGGPAGCGSVLEPNSGKMHRDDLWDLLKAPNAARYCIASDCMMWVADRGPARVDGVEYDSVAYDTGDCGLKRGLRE